MLTIIHTVHATHLHMFTYSMWCKGQRCINKIYFCMTSYYVCVLYLVCAHVNVWCVVCVCAPQLKRECQRMSCMFECNMDQWICISLSMLDPFFGLWNWWKTNNCLTILFRKFHRNFCIVHRDFYIISLHLACPFYCVSVGLATHNNRWTNMNAGRFMEFSIQLTCMVVMRLINIRGWVPIIHSQTHI